MTGCQIDKVEQTFHNVINPSTEEPLSPVPVSTQEDVDKAVAAAQAAYPSWRDLSYEDRARYILRFADAIEANLDGFQDILTREAGKPVSIASAETGSASMHSRDTAKLRLEEEVIEDTDEVCSPLTEDR